MEVLKRLGCGEMLRKDDNLRFCRSHEFETKTFSIPIKLYRNPDDNTPELGTLKLVDVKLPKAINRKGPSSPPNTLL